MARIVVDPVTRIEGHLRVDVEVGGGRITKAWSSAQMYRGIETILQGRDPRDAWIFAQRFCGVCTTTHALASIRSVEDALKVEVPLNAQYIRNIITAAHCIQDNIVHFYHLSALDWVDIVSALKADPARAAQIAQSYSDWGGNNVHAFRAAKERLAAFVKTGKLGIFGNAYWGHPAYKLPPEVNLIGFAHYIKALDYQRIASNAVAVLGSKEPHIQNLVVGGVSNAINVDSPATLNFERIALIEQNVREAQEFVDKVYLPDVLAIASFYPEWFNYGAGVTNYMSIPEFPTDTKSTQFMQKGGLVAGGNFREVTGWNDKELREKTMEDTTRAWFKTSNLNPFVGKDEPMYTQFQDDGKYSWCKAPNYENKPYQVGPLAQVLAAYHAGDKEVVAKVNLACNVAKIQPRHLHSTMGRHAARAIRASTMAEVALKNIDMLRTNIANGDQNCANHVMELPKGRFQGVGWLEAPRGALSHWIVIENGKIANYSAVVPTTWNAAPRNHNNEDGPYEACLVGNPVAKNDQPLEIIRTIHSFDPCIACAVHTVDPEGKEVVNITVD